MNFVEEHEAAAQDRGAAGARLRSTDQGGGEGQMQECDQRTHLPRKKICSLCNMQGTHGLPLMTAQMMQLSPRWENAGLEGDRSKKKGGQVYFSFLAVTAQTTIREYEVNASLLQTCVVYRLGDVASNSSEMVPTPESK